MTTVQVDTVAALAAGTYAPGTTIQLKRGNTYQGPITFSQSGTAGAPIQFSYYGDPSLPRPNIVGTQTLFTDALTITGSYVNVDGILISDTNRGGIYLSSGSANINVTNCEFTRCGSSIYGYGSNWMLRYCYVHDMTMVRNDTTPDNDYGANGVTILTANGVNASSIEIDHNLFLRCKAASYDYGTDGGAWEISIAANTTLSNVNIHHNFVSDCDGLLEVGSFRNTDNSFTSLVTGLSVTNNVCVNNNESLKFHNGTGKFPCLFSNVNVAWNTFVDELNSYRNGLFLVYDSPDPSYLTGFSIQYNIVVMNDGKYFFSVTERGTHYYNCLYSTSLAPGTVAGLKIYNDYSSTLGTGEIFADPLFTNQAARNFTLQPGSPAAGMGAGPIDFSGANNPSLTTALGLITMVATVTTPIPAGTVLNLPPAPGQANMAGSLPFTLASDQPAVPTAPAAGEAHLGEIGGNTTIAVASLTRPANTTAYAVGQVVANSATAGSVTPLSFTVARKNGGTGRIPRARLSSSNTAALGATVRAHLYRASPTTTAGDGAAFAGATNGVTSVYLGSFDITMDKSFSDGAKGSGVPNVGAYVAFDTVTGTQTIFALLEARTAYTPASGETLTLALEVDRD